MKIVKCKKCGHDLDTDPTEISHGWHNPNPNPPRVIVALSNINPNVNLINWDEIKELFPYEWTQMCDNPSVDSKFMNEVFLDPRCHYIREKNITMQEFVAAFINENNKHKCASMPVPTSDDLTNIIYHAIYQTINSWDINVPEFYQGYMGANQSHAKLIYDAISIAVKSKRIEEAKVDHEKKPNKFAPKNKKAV